ncbi:MAG: hypothetical protein QNJ40_14920 [Xanthomonadales bacterium]|nr:hypothetical protein [Xanthomonadales bacterium]
MTIRSLAVAACLAIVGCTGDSSTVAPTPLPPVEVKGGSARIDLVHLDQTLVFDHVKAIQRHDEEAGADRILVVFTQQDVEALPLTHPFEAFDVRRWSLAKHPEEIRAVVSVLIDPATPTQPLACDVFAEQSWLQGACGQYDSSLEVTVTEGSIRGALTMLDFFGMKYEDRGWRATGTFEVPIARIDPPSVVEGTAAIASPQVKRLQAMEAALVRGDLTAMEQHVTPEAYAEYMEAAEQWGEEELLGMMQGMAAMFEDLQVTDENVSVRLYNAGERSRLVLEKKEENSTTTEISDFRWTEGRWLLDS